jgi:uncharacterized protein
MEERSSFSTTIAGQTMLISFAVTNFRSFGKRQELLLVRGPGRKHANHLVENGGTRPTTLRCAAIYGANGAGKSNLVRAMLVAQQLIKTGFKEGDLIPVAPHRLDPALADQPSVFEFVISVPEGDFVYGIAATSTEIRREWCAELKRGGQHDLFVRTEEKSVRWTLGESTSERSNLDFLFDGLKPTRLILAELAEQKVFERIEATSKLASVFRWFAEQLTVIVPDSQYLKFGNKNESERSVLGLCGRLLRDFGTGVQDIKPVLQKLTDKHGIPPELVELIKRDDRSTSVVLNAFDDLPMHVKKDDGGNLVVEKIKSEHRGRDGSMVEFDWSDESDGTKRLLHLLPALLELFGGEKVVVIDELNRSLHVDLTLNFLSAFLAAPASTRSQLIFTTHETNLLSQELFRRDEIWFAQKRREGMTELIPLSDFKLRGDKDLRRDYLRGRFGGVPLIKDMSWVWSANDPSKPADQTQEAVP